MVDITSSTLSAAVPRPLPPPRPAFDPLAQTFMVPRNLPDAQDGTEGIFLSKIRLYFESKSSRNEVTLEVREVENGYPTRRVLPFGKVVKKPNEVNEADVSDDEWTGHTDFEFDSPIHIQTETEYCFVIKPGGDSHDYRVHISRLGGEDTLTGLPITRDPGVGVLFLSTNDRTWVAHKDENVKFDLYCRKFDTAESTINFVNDDYIFLNMNHNADAIPFAGGMDVYIAGNAVGKVVSWESTQLVIKKTATGSVGIADDAKVEGWYDSNGVIPVSTATDYNLMVANGTVQSDNTNNLDIAWFEPRVYRGQYSGAGVTDFSYHMDMDISNPALGSLGVERGLFNDRNYTIYNPFGGNNVIVSADSSQPKSFLGRVKLSSENPYLSPTIDTQSCSVVAYESLINNTVVDEYKPGGGDADAKYISQTVELVREAEDLRVILAGYLPVGTEASVYARVLHAADSRRPRDQYWSKLERIGPAIYSASQNRGDYVEHEYQIQRPTMGEQATLVDADVGYNRTANAKLFTTFRNGTTANGNLVAAEDLVLITRSPIDYRIARVDSVSATADAGTLTLENDLDSDFGAGPYTVGKINSEYVYQAFRDQEAEIEGTAVYYTPSGDKFEGFKTFAVKVILTSDDTRKIPSVRDLRVIALDI